MHSCGTAPVPPPGNNPRNRNNFLSGTKRHEARPGDLPLPGGLISFYYAMRLA